MIAEEGGCRKEVQEGDVNHLPGALNLLFVLLAYNRCKIVLSGELVINYSHSQQ